MYVLEYYSFKCLLTLGSANIELEMVIGVDTIAASITVVYCT